MRNMFKFRTCVHNVANGKAIKRRKVANSFEMTMKEADIDQNGIQTEACLCTNRFKCLLYYFCFGRIDNSTRFCYFFIGVSTPGKNRTQFIDQYNTTANKRISYSSRLFEVTCCRIKNGGGSQHPSIDCQLFVHCFVVYFSVVWEWCTLNISFTILYVFILLEFHYSLLVIMV